MLTAHQRPEVNQAATVSIQVGTAPCQVHDHIRIEVRGHLQIMFFLKEVPHLTEITELLYM